MTFIYYFVCYLKTKKKTTVFLFLFNCSSWWVMALFKYFQINTHTKSINHVLKPGNESILVEYDLPWLIHFIIVLKKYVYLHLENVFLP